MSGIPVVRIPKPASMLGTPHVLEHWDVESRRKFWEELMKRHAAAKNKDVQTPSKMGLLRKYCRLGLWTAFWTVMVAFTIGWYHVHYMESIAVPDDGYWGPTEAAPPPDDEAVYLYRASFDEQMVETLKEELSRTKWTDPVENTASKYGVNLKSFREVINHWRSGFDFKKAEEDMNALPHYKTQIEGLKIHFLRSAPAEASGKNKDVRVFPLLLVHGWPSSFVQYLTIARELARPVSGVAFDVIVPSMPGFGYSDAPKKEGMDILKTAHLFRKLMIRLGYSKFYMAGDSLGGLVTTAMGTLYPNSLRGIHVTFVLPNVRNPWTMLKLFLFVEFPSLLGDGQLPSCMPTPLTSYVGRLLRETGYMHLHATKPDAAGFSLLNSPAGLAAYILERFSALTMNGFRLREDGGLTQKFTLDELLSNVMVYYASGSVVSSLRYYRENLLSGSIFRLFNQGVKVPAGYLVFPNDISCVPRSIASDIYRNLTWMTYMKDGGHFGAFENPGHFERDLRMFVISVEKAYPQKLASHQGFKVVTPTRPPIPTPATVEEVDEVTQEIPEDEAD